MVDITGVLYRKNVRKILKKTPNPLNVLPVFSKVFQRSMFGCLYKCLGFLITLYQNNNVAFRKGYSVEQCLLALLEKWKLAVNSGQMFSALLKDLLRHLIVSITNYWLPNLAHAVLFHDYWSNRNQGTKVNRTYSSWLEIIFGAPQGFILGPLLFNIFLADLFSILNNVDIANYADDNTPYVITGDINGVIRSLKKA